MKKVGKKAGLMPPSRESENEERREKKTIKKTGKFKGKSNKLGGGGRFAQMVASGKSPALAAFIGQKVYGKKKMAKMSAAGRSK